MNVQMSFLLPLSSPCFPWWSISDEPSEEEPFCIRCPWHRLSSESPGEWVDIGGVTGGLWSDPTGGEMDMGGAFMLSGLKCGCPWLGWRCGWIPIGWWWDPRERGWCEGGGNCGKWAWGCCWINSLGRRISWIRRSPLAHMFMLLAKWSMSPPLPVPPLTTPLTPLGCILWGMCIPLDSSVPLLRLGDFWAAGLLGREHLLGKCWLMQEEIRNELLYTMRSCPWVCHHIFFWGFLRREASERATGAREGRRDVSRRAESRDQMRNDSHPIIHKD